MEIKTRNKLVDNVEQFLQKPRGYKKSWLRSLFALLLCTIAFSVIIGLSYTYGPLSGKTSTSLDLVGRFGQASNAQLLNTATYMSIAGLCILIFPFICAMATWLIGINQVSTSKYFHLFLWLSIALAIILSIVCIILIVRASIFNETEFPAPPPEDGGESSRQLSLIKHITNISYIMC